MLMHTIRALMAMMGMAILLSGTLLAVFRRVRGPGSAPPATSG